MRRTAAFTVALVAMINGSVWSTIINIPGQYPTIQQGIDATVDGDTVLVQPGTYVESINFNGHNIVLGSLYLITGDSSYISATFIDANDSATVIIFESGEDSTAIIAGFTIQNGYGQQYNATGGGIICSQSSPTIIGNIIQDNRCFEIDFIASGGGIYCSDASPRIIGNVIRNNNVEGYGPPPFPPPNGIGGGIACMDSSNPIIKNNVILDNSSNYKGGGIYIESGSNPLIVNNMICYNTAGHIVSGNAGGLYCGNSGTIITNTIIWGNNAGDSAEIAGLPNVSYSNIKSGWPGIGNIDADPLFLDFYNNNFNICAQSPCIDAGDPNITDPDSTRSDIGVFYFEHPDCPGGNTWYVSITGSDTTGDGSPGNPFRTVQRAINIALSGDSVIVGNGTYEENITCSKMIFLGSNYIHTQDTLDIQNTIIDGSNDTTGTVTIKYHSDQAAIRGFTITRNGDASNAGIYCVGSDPSISKNLITGNGRGIDCRWSGSLIYDNLISDNSSRGILCGFNSDAIISDNIISGNADGGINISYSNPLVSGNTISDNYMETQIAWGAGIYCYRSSATINDNIITNNTINASSRGRGGGIEVNESEAIITHNIISNNTVNGNTNNYLGGGIYCWSTSNVVIRNNVISGNTAYRGGGIYNTGLSEIRGNILKDNYAVTGGGIFISTQYSVFINNTVIGNMRGIFCDYGYSPSISNCIVWGNIGDQVSGMAVITYSDVQDTLWPGEGNISTDPLFRDPYNGDFHLMGTYCGDPYDSPCIDVGDPAILDSLLDCSWGLGTILSDMGAYGGGDSVQVGIESRMDIPVSFTLSQNYPNPFNASTSINYDLPKASDVTLEVYDILGRRAATLIREKQQAGYHSVVWKADGFSSGMYFYRIQAGEYTETKKMVLMK